MLQYGGRSGEEEKGDEPLEALAETAAELLADICVQIQKVKLNSANLSFYAFSRVSDLSFILVGDCGRFGEGRLSYGGDVCGSCSEFNPQLSHFSKCFSHQNL